MTARHAIVLIFCGTAQAATSGCERPEEISHYRVPKPEALAEINRNETSARILPTKTRLLGAIVPHGQMLWFFKLMGPAAAVSAQSGEFVSFIESVHFTEGEDTHPEWTLPEGWRQLPGNKLRFATLAISSDKPPLELAVSALPQSGDLTRDLMGNIFRWYGQVNLPKPSSRKEMAKSVQPIEIGGESGAVVNLAGETYPNASSMGQPPFAKGAQ